MLTWHNKYSIASTLSTSNLSATISKLSQLPDAQEAIEFAKMIDKYYGKRDGHVPRKVIALCK